MNKIKQLLKKIQYVKIEFARRISRRVKNVKHSLCDLRLPFYGRTFDKDQIYSKLISFNIIKILI